MFHKGSCSARRLLLFLAALTMLLLPLSAYAEEPPDADYDETKVIPGYEENAYGYQYTGVATIVTIPAEITEMNRHMFYNNNAVRAWSILFSHTDPMLWNTASHLQVRS